ncbi:hypothetical protein PC128_g18139 [Phytophthora cactorum]|nr:hypothetical protein PC128_g18139 [Phytophthora cactorum]
MTAVSGDLPQQPTRPSAPSDGVAHTGVEAPAPVLPEQSTPSPPKARRSKGAKNNATIGKAWLLLASKMSRLHDIEPPELALMLEYWASSSKMNGQTLADNEEDTNTAEMEANTSGDTTEAETAPTITAQGKKRKTMADSFEVGMKSKVDSFQAMAAAMTTTAPHSATGDIMSAIDKGFRR